MKQPFLCGHEAHQLHNLYGFAHQRLLFLVLWPNYFRQLYTSSFSCEGIGKRQEDTHFLDIVVDIEIYVCYTPWIYMDYNICGWSTVAYE